MAIDLDVLFKKDAFKTIGPERLQLFKQFARDIEGKSAPEIASLYMKLNQALSKSNPITTNERNAIAGAIRESLPPSDRAKFNGILKILNIRG